MTITEQILKHKHANQPFTIHLSDGRRFVIPHPVLFQHIPARRSLRPSEM